MTPIANKMAINLRELFWLPLLAVHVFADVPSWTPTYQLNQSTFVYICNYSGYTDVSPGSVVSRFGLVAFDWSNAKADWANQHPMDCEERLVAQAIAVKRGRPHARVMVYRNLVKALPWFSTVRTALEDPKYAGFFLRFKASGPTHSPRCDGHYDPARCSDLYHDQIQTPQYPNNSKYDGTCLAPCDCGSVPCGEYLFDFRNGTLLEEFLISKFVMGPTGLASGAIDGFFLDDGWTNISTGSNACDGSPVGGPSEVDSFCAGDIGLTQADTTAITSGWQTTLNAVHREVLAAGGFTWPQFVQIGTPANDTATCTAFFREACGPTGKYLNSAVLHTFTEKTGRIFDPLPAFEQDLAAFLLLRGPHAWIGYAWNGCSFGANPAGGRQNQSFSFPDRLDSDYGVPVPLTGGCTETVPGISGVFTRTWSRAHVQFDCQTWAGSITQLPLGPSPDSV